MKILKRLFCKHNKVICTGHVLNDGKDNIWRYVRIWTCQHCGKEFHGAPKKRKKLWKN